MNIHKMKSAFMTLHAFEYILPLRQSKVTISIILISWQVWLNLKIDGRQAPHNSGRFLLHITIVISDVLPSKLNLVDKYYRSIKVHIYLRGQQSA